MGVHRPKCVRLAAAGQYLEFTAKAVANAMVVRYSLPDAPDGGGIDATLSLYQNGKFLRKLPVTSKYTWLVRQVSVFQSSAAHPQELL